ncbi:MAG: hypothetical protein ACJ748_10880 [Flavisolibacter sp.]
MKKTILYYFLITIIAAFALIINGCKKENSSSTNLSPQQEEEIASISAQSQTETELASNDVFNNIIGANNDVGLAGIGVFGRTHSTSSGEDGRDYGLDSITCFSVTITHLTSDSFPVKIVLDFGSGCLGKDGHMRYGKIITEYSGRLILPGKTSTTTFDGYKIDSFSIEGTYSITNTSSGGLRQFTVDISNGKISKPSGDYIQWEDHRVITQIEGTATPDWPIDDALSIEGSSHSKVKRGNNLYAFATEITDPLIKKFTCAWIIKGVLKARRETSSSNTQWAAILDYGSGTCDNKATVTINGISHQITLH